MDVNLSSKDSVVLTYLPGGDSGFYAVHIVHEYDVDAYHVTTQDTKDGSHNQHWRGDFKSCLGWLKDFAIDLEHDFRYSKSIREIQASDGHPYTDPTNRGFCQFMVDEDGTLCKVRKADHIGQKGDE